MHGDGLALIFARHGRTAWNLDGRYQGRSDPPISPEGEVDAEALAETLSADAVSVIIASPLQRAAATARIVGERLRLEPASTDQRLMEIAYGAWEGLTQAEVKQRWPAQLRQWKQAPETMRFPGGETLAEARSRLLAFLRDLVRPDRCPPPGPGGGSILVVGHGGLIRLAVIEARRAPLSDFRRIDVEPGSVHRFVLRRAPGSAALLLAS